MSLIISRCSKNLKKKTAKKPRRLLKPKRFAKRRKPPLPLPRQRKIITRFEKKGLKMVGMKLLEEEI